MGRPYYETTMADKDYISEVVLGRNSGRFIINFASPVKDREDRIQGLVLGSIRTATLTELLRGAWAGQTSQFYLINKDGFILAGPNPSAALNPRGATRDTGGVPTKASEDLIRQIRQGASESVSWTDWLGKRVMGHYIDVPERGWTIIGRIEEAEAMAPVFKQSVMLVTGLLLLFLCVIPLSYKIDKTMKTLDENAARFEAMMTQSKEAILLCELDTGRIVEANEASVEMFGYAEEELLTLHACELEIVSENSCPDLWRERQILSTTVVRRCKDGRAISVECTMSLIRHQEKNMALFTYRFLSEARKLQEKVQKDIALAGQIQRKLLQGDFLHREVTLHALFYPSQYVSGDHYGYQWASDGNLLNGFLLDVSGHGFATAIQTAAIGTLCSELMAMDIPWSKETLMKLNGQISNYLAEEAFAGIFVFSLDVKQQMLICITGGINRFLVSTQTRQGWVVLPGSYLGIDKSAQFEQMTFALSPGDSFYFLTDGMTDRMGQGVPVDVSDFGATLQWLEQLAADPAKKDDSSGICLCFHGNTTALNALR